MVRRATLVSGSLAATLISAAAALAQESGEAETVGSPPPAVMPTPPDPDASESIQADAPSDLRAADLGRELRDLLNALTKRGDPENGEAEADSAEQEREVNEALRDLVGRMEALESREAALKDAVNNGEAGPPELGRDPFAITDRLTRVSTGGTEGVQFVPAASVPSGREIPRMRLRGIMRMEVGRNGKANGKSDGAGSGGSAGDAAGAEENVAAILEVDGAGVHIVRRGDTVGLHRLGSNAVLKVLRVDRLSLVVEVGSLGQVIVVR